MSLFQQALVYLAAAVIAVPIAKRLGLGSVLGYLLAGVVIGPFALHLVGEPEEVMHVAEFGVVIMLFLIGLELRPALLWQLRGPVFGLGSLQVAATALVVGGIALLTGLPWQQSLAIGLMLAMSSTAIVLQTLNEKGLMKTSGGESSFAVLLFQDIAVIPILALLPLLGSGSGQNNGPETIPPWLNALILFGAVGAVVIAGRYLMRPVLRYIAATDLRELFTATTLLLVVGIALLMEKVGLSAALGTFLAGVLLSESEYRVQLEADLEPFKGLLLGLFFISVGSGLDLRLIGREPLLIALLVLGLIVVKFGVLRLLAWKFGMDRGPAFLFAFALAQGGEFAFVLFSFAAEHSVLTPELTSLLNATVALSMAISPILFTINDKLVQSRTRTPAQTREPDRIDEKENPVILAGFGRFGHIVGRLLRLNGYGTTVLDHDPDQVDTLRQFGLKSFYGDASRLDLLEAAGARNAKLFILAIDDEARGAHIIQTVQRHFPHLKIMARARSRQHAYELIRMGISDIVRETLGSALDLGIMALRELGLDEQRAARAAQLLREHDEASVHAMARIPVDLDTYISVARHHIENLEKALQSDAEFTTGIPPSNGGKDEGSAGRQFTAGIPPFIPGKDEGMAGRQTESESK